MKKTARAATPPASPKASPQRSKAEATPATSPVRKKMPAEVFVKIWGGEMEVKGTEWEAYAVFDLHQDGIGRANLKDVEIEEDILIENTTESLLHLALSNCRLPNLVMKNVEARSFFIQNNCTAGDFSIRDNCKTGSFYVFNSCKTGNFEFANKCRTGGFEFANNCEIGKFRVLDNCKTEYFEFSNNCTTLGFQIRNRCTTGYFDFKSKCTTGDFEISDKCTTGNFSIQHNCTAGDFKIWERCTLGDFGIRNSCTAGDFLIRDSCSTGNFEISDNCTTGKFQILDNCTTGYFSITRYCTTGKFQISDKCTTGNFWVVGRCTTGYFEISDICETGNFEISDNCTTDYFEISDKCTIGNFWIADNCTTGYFEIWKRCTLGNFGIRNNCTIDYFEILNKCTLGDFGISNSKSGMFLIEESLVAKLEIQHTVVERIQIGSDSFVSYFKCQFNLQEPVHLLLEKSSFGHLDFDNSVFAEFTTLSISDCAINRVSQNNFCNYGTVFFSGLKPLENWQDFKKNEFTLLIFEWGNYQFESVSRPSTLRLTDSDLGKMQFINCDLRQFQRFEFSNTKMLEVFVAGSQMPSANAFCLPDDEQNPSKLAEQKRLAYGQFKKIYEARGDVAGSLRYLAYEMRAYRELLGHRIKRHRAFSRQWLDYVGELGILWLNQVSTNYGNNWLRGVGVTLLVIAVCFAIFLWAIGYPIGDPTKWQDWERLGHLYSYSLHYLNPFRDLDSIALEKEENLSSFARFWDLFSRIIVAYFVYQTIQAFRKLGKSSG